MLLIGHDDAICGDHSLVEGGDNWHVLSDLFDLARERRSAAMAVHGPVHRTGLFFLEFQPPDNFKVGLPFLI